MGLIEQEFYPSVEGASVREWQISPESIAIFPYSQDGRLPSASMNALKHFWRFRVHLGNRKSLSGTQEDRGLPWFTYSDFHADRWAAEYRISFAFVVTHNHFALDRGGKVCNRSAPIIKLLDGATENDHLALLGVLNSSTTCFWLKQVSQAKTGASNTSGGGDRWSPEPWFEFYEFTGTKLEQFPLAASLPLKLGRELETLSQRLSSLEPLAVGSSSVPIRAVLDAALAEHESVRSRMIALQEELDWGCLPPVWVDIR